MIAQLFYFLNCDCLNGLYHFNKSGFSNLPFGAKGVSNCLSEKRSGE